MKQFLQVVSIAFFLCMCSNALLAQQAKKQQYYEVKGEQVERASYNYVLGRQFKASKVYQIDLDALNERVKSDTYNDLLYLDLGEDLQVDMTLFESDVRSKDLIIRVNTAEGEKRMEPRKNITYRGYVNNGEGEVRMTITDDLIMGLFTIAGKEYMLESMQHFLPGADKDEFVLYQTSDVKQDAPMSCGVTAAQELDVKTPESNEKAGAVCRDLEIAIATDYRTYLQRGSDEVNVSNYMVSILNLVEGDYVPFELTYKLVELYISTCRQCDPWDYDERISETVLANFDAWGPSTTGFMMPHDIGQFWTGRPTDGTVLGIAWRPGACNTFFRYNVIWHGAVGSSTNLARVTSSHEIGHNLSAQHNDPSTGDIMDPFANPGAFTWSAQSTTDIGNFLNNVGCIEACTPIECDIVEDFEVVNSSSNSFDLAWMDTETEYRIRTRPFGTTTWTSTLLSGIGSPYTYTGLAPCNVYEVQIQALCDNGEYGYPTTIVHETARIQINNFFGSPTRVCDGDPINFNASLSNSGLTLGTDYTINIVGPGGTLSNTTSGTINADYNGSGGDNDPPTLNIIGGSSIVVNCGETYNDPGFNASDTFNGNTVDLTNEVVTNTDVVCTSAAGTYIQTYLVEDAGGNVTSANRYVIVIGDCNTACTPVPPPSLPQCSKDRSYTLEVECLASGIVLSETINVTISPPLEYSILNENSCVVGVQPSCDDFAVTFNDGQGNSGLANTYDANSFGTGSGTVTFTITNTNAPAPSDCLQETVQVNFQCTNCEELLGQSCDDGNDCTIGDAWDDSCNCVGTPLEFDCLGECGGTNVVGSACDDGNECTVDDKWTTICLCAGTPIGQPDCAGVCGGDAEEGSPCDDGNDCTINDVYDNNCNCLGEVQPEDCEGVCGGDALPGTPCDDGNPDTVNDTYNFNCFCIGEQEEDCEGTPGGDALPGTACDDNDATTTNDTWDAACNCVGQKLGCTDDTACNFDPEAVVEDNSCLQNDCEGTCGGTVGAGDTCDDGDPNTINDVYDNLCNCAGDKQGCTDDAACNFDPEAVIDDNSCILPDGCTDNAACNFDPTATCNDPAICIYETTCDEDACTNGGIYTWDNTNCECVLSTPTMLGCTDDAACNFEPTANCNDDSCIYESSCNNDCSQGPITEWDAVNCACVPVTEVEGCNDDTACNFEPAANCNDGSCLYETACNGDCTTGDLQVWDPESCQCVVSTIVVDGCNDPAACNFEPTSNCDDGSCIYETTCDEDACTNGGTYVWDDTTCECVLDTPTADGCNDNTACNFDPEANCNDGSCIYETACNQDCLQGDLEVWDASVCACVVEVEVTRGCTDDTACNFEPEANCDNGTCILPDGCTDPNFCEYDPSAQCDDGSCATPNTDPGTCNTDICAGDTEVWNSVSCSCDIDIAQILGCTDVNASNFNSNANCDDGSCIYDVPGCSDAEASNFDPLATVNDGSCEYEGCTDETAYNYDPRATTDDGTCFYADCVIDFEVEDLSQGNQGGITPFYYNAHLITLNSGTPPFNYEWDAVGYVRNAILGNGELKVLFGDNATWAVTITDAVGCTAIISEDVFNGGENGNTTLDIVDVDITSQSFTTQGAINISVAGGTISSGSDAIDYCYEWSTGATTQDVYGLSKGWYSVTVCDDNCEADAQCTSGWYWVPFSQPSGRGKNELLNGLLQAYPNPFIASTTIEFGLATSEFARISIFSLEGQRIMQVFEGKLEAGEIQRIDFEAGPLPTGMYMLQLETTSGVKQVQKLVITK